MDITYHTQHNSFEQVSSFQSTILEFDKHMDNPEDILYRAQHLKGTFFSAVKDGEVVGVLFAYEEKKAVWYNHITAVSPGVRGVGVATKLIDMFENYAEKEGGKRLTVKSMNCFPNMLRRLIALKYQIVGIEGEKILFNKSI